MQIVVAVFGIFLAGICGYIFGYMQGGTEAIREQNDRMEASNVDPHQH